MKITGFALITILFLLGSCIKEEKKSNDFMIGGDFSILKKMLDEGGEYKLNEIVTPPLEIFIANGYNYGRLRLFHTPNMRGPVCNSLDYTIALAKEIKASGMKLLLDFHYSDTWADPQKQFKPKAWENLSFTDLTDSVYNYSEQVILKMKNANVLPDMVQIGNEITPGMIWPDGKIYKDSIEDWKSFCTLLKAGIDGVNAAYQSQEVPIMLHIDKGGDKKATEKFFNKMNEFGIEFDLIGLSYYPWWHGTFDNLRDNLSFLSQNFPQDIIIVETAYYANGHYPEPDKWVLDIQPYPPTEDGQFQFLVDLKTLTNEFPKVKGIFYWKPDGLSIPESKVWFIGRSLFDKEGNALKGISAFKPAE